MVTALIKKYKYLSFTPVKQQIFLEDLSSLIEDGVPVKQSVEIVAQVGVGIVVEVASDILLKISEGKYVADGMIGWFPNHIVEIIRAGEEGGALAKTMASAAESLNQKASILSSLLASLTYPFVVICAGLFVTVFINHSIFNSFRAILPLPQWPMIGRDVADFADFVEHWWWALIIFIMIAAVAIQRLLYSYVGEARQYLDTIPGLALYRQINAARFMETLGLLIANGVVLKKALKILQSRANPYLYWHLLTMEYRLGGGKENIAEVLDTGLIDQTDLMRLKVIARGKGFDHALQRQGRYALQHSSRNLKMMGRVCGGVLLGLGGLLAVFLITGIYTVGSSVGSY